MLYSWRKNYACLYIFNQLKNEPTYLDIEDLGKADKAKDSFLAIRANVSARNSTKAKIVYIRCVVLKLGMPNFNVTLSQVCLLYTSDAADE